MMIFSLCGCGEIKNIAEEDITKSCEIQTEPTLLEDETKQEVIEDEVETTIKENKETTSSEPVPNYQKPLYHYTHEEEIIETQYVTWVIEADNSVRNDLAEITDETCKILEEISGLQYKEKITIDVKEEYLGGSGCYDFITLSNRSFFIDQCNIFVHELSHCLQDQNSGNLATDCFYSEGYAEYMTFKFAEFTKEKNENLFKLLNIKENLKDSETERGYLESNLKIYDKDIDYWLDLGINIHELVYDNWTMYYFGRIFMLYLERVYGSAQTWIQFVDNPNDNYCDNTEAGTIEGYKRMMIYAYGDDVFDNFYPWVKENEEMINEFFYEKK